MRAVDKEYRADERLKNEMRMTANRLNELLRFREAHARSIYKNWSNRESDDYNISLLIADFLRDKEEGPENVCDSCDNLFSPKSMKTLNIETWEQKYPKQDQYFKNFISILKTKSGSVCLSCYKALIKYEIPKMAASEDLGFPDLPEEITSLFDVEERMVAPYVLFMQINPLLPFAINPQLSLAGSIVNISVDINDMLQILPRNYKINLIDQLASKI
ncbi:hypothetical protein QAD02_013867 [Eretmocerus hayati]|uniref:Uncharacterized protein n=1 Tax=Eretmocerus hayati TaxID=131215 RepID=A0ACC2P3X4_9HYME|nr:hypothetical protein QAD02_013867 [Eretmocerus hayati]